MALRALIVSFPGWNDDAQRLAFLTHFLGGDIDTQAPKSAAEVKNMSVSALKEECKRLGIKGYNGKTKDELKQKIAEHDPTKTKKSKKDKTKKVELPDGFVLSEFAENFDEVSKDEKACNAILLKRLIGKQVFNVKATQEMEDAGLLDEDEKKDVIGETVSSFGKTKDALKNILKIHFKTIDIDALRAKEAEETSSPECSESETETPEPAEPAEPDEPDEPVSAPKKAKKAKKAKSEETEDVEAPKPKEKSKKDKKVKKDKKKKKSSDTDDDAPIATAAAAEPESDTERAIDDWDAVGGWEEDEE
jgi:outer membrane biosynthesis protein TonB